MPFGDFIIDGKRVPFEDLGSYLKYELLTAFPISREQA